MEAFRINVTTRGAYNAARASASRLLTSDNIINRINELLEAGGFNDENVDKQHTFLLNQFGDLKTKLGAIKEYNELRGRIKKNQDPIDIKINLIDYGNNDSLQIRTETTSVRVPKGKSKI